MAPLPVIFVPTGVAVLLMWRHRGVVAVPLALFAAALLAGSMGAARERATLAAAVPEGEAHIAVRVLSDPAPTRSGGLAFSVAPARLDSGDGWQEWRGPRLLVFSDEPPPIVAGETAVVTGRVRARPGRYRGDPVAGTVDAVTIAAVGSGNPLFRAGNLVRRRVESGLDSFGSDPRGALVSGFLIGDVRTLPDADAEALRLAGLSHFVAVSGSNVALFLAAWWLAMGPLAMGPRRRALIGLAGLVLFVVITRWEPSVVRAATMAGLVLGGRLAGFPVAPWTALGSAVTLLLLVAPELARDAGFQLSVAATAGVVAGAGLAGARRPRWAWTALAATASAQIAVAPLLLLHFGALPLLAPVTNLVAGPLVVLATSLGGIGVMIGAEALIRPALVAAGGVLAIARTAAGWPQLDVAGVGAMAGATLLGLSRRLRPLVIVACASVTASYLVGGAGLPGQPTVVFLDVGQGDAALLLGPDGETVMIDGGPDRGVVAALRRRNLDRIDLLVASHPHADHVTGLTGIVESGVAVGAVWHPGFPHPTPAMEEFLDAADRAGIPVTVPSPGWAARIGVFRLDVVGPLRRYASPNDQSLVIMVSANGRTALFPGDVETIAQSELGPLPADILKVPHQGAATSDPEWLAASAGDLAVVSVGPNDFGHPSSEVIAVLEAAGATVVRTDEVGDVEVPLVPSRE